MSVKEEIEHVTGSSNVFADLGLEDADDLFTRAQLGAQIFKILKQRGLKKQKDIATVLGIDKSEASKLMNAEFNRFSEGRLMSFLNKLDYKITMEISPLRKGEQPQQVIMS
jgi:predicted XRE-type DNA-binding protein